MSKTKTLPTLEVLPENPCVGRCGVIVHASKFGCPECWPQLPEELQRPIAATYSRGNIRLHLQATMRARAWFAGRTGLRFTRLAPAAAAAALAASDA